MATTLPYPRCKIAYLPYGPTSGWLYGNGLTLTRSFDQDYRLSSLLASNGGAITIQNLSYGYDLASNITAITDTLASARSQSFQYDALYRLTQAIGAYGTFAYGYDNVGNRLTRSLTGSASNFSETYAYAGTSNRLQTVTNASTVRTLSYDATGNIAGDDPGGGGPARTLSYTPGQRLSQVATSSPLGAYTYDAFEQRVAAAAGGTTTQFLFDLAGMPLAEYDGAGALQREYIGLEGEVAPVALVAGGALSFIHTDHLGTVQAITDASAALVWEGVYRPFGQADTPTTTLANNLRFPGQYRDTATGYHQNWFRDYDPTLGRYLQSDPIGLAGGINTYGYVGGNPVNDTDPSGEYVQACAFNAWCRGVVVGTAAAGGNVIYQLSRNNWRFACVDWNEVGSAFSLGFLVGSGLEIFLARGAVTTIFRTTHYAPRLRAAGVSVRRAELEVSREISAIRRYMSSNSAVSGRFRADGVLIEYRAYKLTDDIVNVGTIFKVMK